MREIFFQLTKIVFCVLLFLMDAESTPRRRGRARTRQDIGTVRALVRGLDVLDALAARGQATLSEISRDTKLAPSTAYRILETLRSRGYSAFHSATGLYRLGIRAFETGYAFVSHTHLRDAANPVMLDLADQTGETVNLAVLDGREVVYVHQVEGAGMMRLFTKIGGRAPVHCTGVGKCLLAWKPEVEISKHLPESPYERFTAQTIVTKENYLKVLAKVRRNGYALDDEEREEGVVCVTAPVRNEKKEVIAAISVSGPVSRVKKGGTADLAKIVKQAGNEISKSLESGGHLGS